MGSRNPYTFFFFCNVVFHRAFSGSFDQETVFIRLQTFPRRVLWRHFSWQLNDIGHVCHIYVDYPLHWRNNYLDGVSNHQPHGCLLNRIYRRRSKETSKLRVTGVCVGNSPGPVDSPHKGQVTPKNVSIHRSSDVTTSIPERNRDMFHIARKCWIDFIAGSNFRLTSSFKHNKENVLSHFTWYISGYYSLQVIRRELQHVWFYFPYTEVSSFGLNI